VDIMRPLRWMTSEEEIYLRRLNVRHALDIPVMNLLLELVDEPHFKAERSIRSQICVHRAGIVAVCSSKIPRLHAGNRGMAGGGGGDDDE